MTEQLPTFNISYINTKLVDGIWTYIHSWMSINIIQIDPNISSSDLQQTLQQNNLLSSLLSTFSTNTPEGIIIHNALDGKPFMILHTNDQTPAAFLKMFSAEFIPSK